MTGTTSRLSILPLEVQEHIQDYVEGDLNQHKELFQELLEEILEKSGERYTTTDFSQLFLHNWTFLLIKDKQGNCQHLCDIVRSYIPRIAYAEAHRQKHRFAYYMEKLVRLDAQRMYTLMENCGDCEGDNAEFFAHFIMNILNFIEVREEGYCFPPFNI